MIIGKGGYSARCFAFSDWVQPNLAQHPPSGDPWSPIFLPA